MKASAAQLGDASRSMYGELWDAVLRVDGHAVWMGCPKKNREPSYYGRYLLITFLAALRTLIFLLLTCIVSWFIGGLLPNGGDRSTATKIAVFLFSAFISDLLTKFISRFFGSPSYIEFGERAKYLAIDARVIHWYLTDKPLCHEHCKRRESLNICGFIGAEITWAFAPIGEALDLISRGLRGLFGQRGLSEKSEVP